MNMSNNKMRSIRIEIEHLKILLDSGLGPNRDIIERRISLLEKELEGILRAENKYNNQIFSENIR